MKKRAKQRPPILFYGLLAPVIAAAVIILIVRRETGNTFGLANDDFARLTLLGVVLLFVGCRIPRPQPPAGRGAPRICLLVHDDRAITGVYTNRDNLVGVAGRLLGAIAPGVPISGRIAGESSPYSVDDRPLG